MSYVIQRTTGEYVARPGNASSYTKDIVEAKRYATYDEARVEACTNERVRDLRELFSGGY